MREILKISTKISLLYLVLQELLNFSIFFGEKYINLNFFAFDIWYLFTPLISVALTGFSYLAIKKYYNSRIHRYLKLKKVNNNGAHSFLYGVIAVILLIPQVIPQVLYGFNFLYFAWIIILPGVVLLIIVFNDLVIDDEFKYNKITGDKIKFIYNDLRFTLNKIHFSWITLGTVLAITASFISSSLQNIGMEYDEGVFWIVYAVNCFFSLTLLVGIFSVLPLLNRLRNIKRHIISS